MSTTASPPRETHLPVHTAAAVNNRKRWWRRSIDWVGAKPIPLLFCIGLGLILRFAIPKPHTVTHKAWSMLSIFVVTVAGLISSPLPVGAWAFLCLTVTVATKTLPFKEAFSAYTNEVIWLVVATFFFSKGFMKTGLGDRVAMLFVRVLGKSTLGLAYGLVLGELAISPGMPSSAARAGGIFLPIIKSLSLGAQSNPKDPSARKLGAFLMQCQNQTNNSTSALFLTGAAQNLLCVKFAESLGVRIPNRWVTWTKVSCVPALFSVLVTPMIIYKLYPPELKSTPDAPAMAKEKLKEMGPVKREEWVMLATLLLTIALWIAGDTLNMATAVAAMIGLSLLLLLGVLKWDDCLGEKTAWDTLIWFAILIGMATHLTTLGVVSWLSDCVAHFLRSLSISRFGAFAVLQATYFFLHYLFASQTAHVGALYSAFLGMHLASKIPPLFSALALAYNTNLFGAITHYSSGQAALYYAAGYVSLHHVFMLGITMAVINFSMWGLIAAAWWKILGLY